MDLSTISPTMTSTGASLSAVDVDLFAIMNQQDQRTNLTLFPLDEVYIRQTRRASLFKLLPVWLNPWGRVAGGG